MTRAPADGMNPWTGSVPNGWRTARLKRVAQLINERTELTDRPYLGLENVESGTGRWLPSKDEVEPEGIANLFERHDVLFGKLRPYLAKVYMADVPGRSTGEMLVLRPHEVLPGFLRFVLLADETIKLVDSSTYGVKMPRAEWDFVGRLILPVPKKDQQRAIAVFLDRRTAAIEALIEKKERQIGLLEEKRQVLITRAVTKGLDPNVPMKDSGVSWLGEIPAHWQLSKIRYQAQTVSKGTTPSTVGREMADQGVRFIKAENVEADGYVAPLPEFFIDADTDALLSRSRLRAEDLLIVIAGATTGKTAVLDRSLIPANTNQAVCFVRLKRPPLAPYLQAWLSTRLIQEQVWLNAVQAAQPNLSMEDIRSFVCPRPPDEEARAIIATLLQIRDAFHKIMLACERQIVRLREYRQALISAAVTGKIEIPTEDAA